MTRPLFERRHYEAIARILHDGLVFKPAWSIARWEVSAHVEFLVENFAEMFATDNPNFKRELFMKAVGPHE